MTREDDKVLEALLEALDAGELDGRHALRPALDPAQEEAVRAHIEVLGLLPYELEPGVPASGAKERLLAAVASEPRDGVVEFRPAETPSPHGEREVQTSSTNSVWRRGPWLLAAGLAVVAVGLAGLAASLFQAVREQERQVAVLEVALSDERSATARTAEELELLRDRWELVTAGGIEVCPLRPPGESTPQPGAEGRLWIHPAQQRWLLTASHLQPSGQSRYTIWFISQGQPMRATTFTVQGDAPIRVAHDWMPEDMTGVMVTLEAEELSAPAGPMILWGDERQQIM